MMTQLAGRLSRDGACLHPAQKGRSGQGVAFSENRIGLSLTHFRREIFVGRDQLPARPDLSCFYTFHVNKRSVHMKACISTCQVMKPINHGRAEVGPYPGRRGNKNVSGREKPDGSLPHPYSKWM